MKMEVLLVQNQFQREFGPKLGVQDWNRSFKSPSPPPTSHHHHRITNSTSAASQHKSSSYNNNNGEEDEDSDAIQALANQLQNELKEAKNKHLDCTEVLLPSALLQRVASDMLVMSEKEPCGIRGCTIFIEFQEEPNNVRRIASFKPDPGTVSTFEFYLTLIHNRSSWTSILPQFLKNLARGSTIVISAEYKLNKNKLYRSFAE